MKILSIETSCDETAIAIIEAKSSKKNLSDLTITVLSNVVLSQAKLHEKFGGVFPSLAKREHSRNLVPVLKKALEQGFKISNSPQAVRGQRGRQFLISKKIPNSKLKTLNSILHREPELLKQFLEFVPTIKTPPIDAIAVTYGPGLEPALWVGINFAKALGFIWNIPVIGVNHMEGHIASALLKRESRIINNELGKIIFKKNKNATRYKLQAFLFPMLALLISGGHTELVLIKKWLKYTVIGETQDDAVGEAFDKVARMLNLPYPGGPQISRLAEQVRSRVNGQRLMVKGHILPRPMINSGDFNFSFSGLKTAVLYHIKKIKKLTPKIVREIAYQFEEAVSEVLISKTIKASEKYKIKSIVVGGGVSANKKIREQLQKTVTEKLKQTKLFIPSQELTTDNALMIALAGFIRIKLTKKLVAPKKAEGNLKL